MGKEKEVKKDVIIDEVQEELENDTLTLKVASPEMIEAMKKDLKQGFDFITNIIYTLDVRKDGNMYELRQFAVKDLISARHFAELLLGIEERYTEAHAKIEEEFKEESVQQETDNENGGVDHVIQVNEGVDVTEKV